jgi:hypothetical protein
MNLAKRKKITGGDKMASFSVESTDFEDMLSVAEKFVSEIKENKVSEKAFGLLVVNADIDYALLTKLLQEKLDFPIAGLTALSLIGRETGEDLTAILTVIYDVDFSIAVSEPLNEVNYKENLEAAYKSARDSLKEEPKLILAYAPIYRDIVMDDLLSELELHAGDVPIYGGMASDNQLGDPLALFYNAQLCNLSTILIMLGGDIHPIMEISEGQPHVDYQGGIVTKSEHGFIYEVNNKPFTKFMVESGFASKEEYQLDEILTSFAPSPLKFEVQTPKCEETYIRNIYGFDNETGAAYLASNIPVGSKVVICNLNKSGIRSSTEDCVESLSKKVEKAKSEGHRFSTLLATSCGGRYLVMCGSTNIERDILQEVVPLHVALNGFYSSGEISPTKSNDGTVHASRMHNSSIALCAF